ncbi:GSCOCG00000707001-RA-CDS [Cotesia congregata]|nr:GSCOCG00000707001-RA-CDS [Cotesia congregata]
MIGAMPAVAVRHERRRQEKRLKRPSQLYLGGQWLPPLQGSPPTPSPHGQNSHLDPLPELYLCGKISGLHAVVICLLLGAIVLVVGLVQLAPGATTTDHRLILLIAGATILILGKSHLPSFDHRHKLSKMDFNFKIIFGIILAGVRCYVLHCMPLPTDSPVATPLPPPSTADQSSVAKGTLDLLVGHENPPETEQMIHHHQHHRHHGNHKEKRSSQSSDVEKA